MTHGLGGVLVDSRFLRGGAWVVLVPYPSVVGRRLWWQLALSFPGDLEPEVHSGDLVVSGCHRTAVGCCFGSVGDCLAPGCCRASGVGFEVYENRLSSIPLTMSG